MKTCSKCGQEKDESEFSRSGGKSGSRGPYCKVCIAAYHLAYYYTHKDKVLAACKKYKQEHRAERLVKHHAYDKAHAAERAEYNHRFWAAHPGYARDYWRARPEQSAANKRRFELAHPGYGRERYRANLEKCRTRARAVTFAYRARKRGSPGYDYTTQEMIDARWEVWGGLCYLCGDPATATDHVKPVSKGGAQWPCNLRPICKRCNSKKCGRWPYPPVFARQILESKGVIR